MPFHDSRLPLKNPRAEKPPLLRLEVEHANGVLIKDPNDMAMAVIMEPGLCQRADRHGALAPPPLSM
jgi:hypothetical protein